MISNIQDPEKWKEQFDTIDILRRMLKFHPEILFSNLSSFNSFLKLSVDNLRSGISKNSLMFSNELLKGKFD